MTSLQFPDIDAAQHWYATTLDGLRGLRIAVTNRKTQLSEDIQAELFGMSECDWRSFYEAKVDTHETFSTLALLAACEGGIRRDFEWRSRINKGQEHFSKFNAFYLANKDGHIGVRRIIEIWRTATNHKRYFKCYLDNLSDLFVVRNQLAHGRANQKAYVFSPTYQSLSKIRTKWRDEVHDFRGF